MDQKEYRSYVYEHNTNNVYQSKTLFHVNMWFFKISLEISFKT